MHNIKLRPAMPGDLAMIAGIYGEAVENGTASYELEAPNHAEMQRRYVALVEADYPYLVAEEAGIVLGYAYAGAFRPRPAYRFAVEDSIYVSSRARGRGLGQLLLARLIEECRMRGFRQMLAVIGDARPDSASVRLHERMGFTHAGILRGTGYKHGRWLDTGFMQLAMNGGDSWPPDAQSMPEKRFRAGLKP